MKVDKFHIINLIKDLILAVENNLTNFPKSEIELKKNIRNSSYDMLLIAYEANVTVDLELKKNLIDNLIAKIKYLDFLINLCYDKKIINGKKYVKFGENLDNIIRYSNGWRKMAEQPQTQK